MFEEVEREFSVLSLLIPTVGAILGPMLAVGVMETYRNAPDTIASQILDYLSRRIPRGERLLLLESGAVYAELPCLVINDALRRPQQLGRAGAITARGFESVLDQALFIGVDRILQ